MLMIKSVCSSREKFFIKFSFIFSLLALFFVLFFLNHFLSNYFQKNPVAIENKTLNSDLVKIIRVIDGDTIVSENGQKIRLVGIDTPELNQEGAGKCLADIATSKMKELVEGKTVKIEKDISDIDKYGRLLRYVWVDNQFVNQIMIQGGYAKVYTVNPDIKYRDIFLDYQSFAKEQQLGQWNKTLCQ